MVTSAVTLGDTVTTATRDPLGADTQSPRKTHRNQVVRTSRWVRPVDPAGTGAECQVRAPTEYCRVPRAADAGSTRPDSTSDPAMYAAAAV